MNINGSPDSIETANPQTILLMLLAVAAMIILSVCLLALIVYLRCKICLIETVDPETGRDTNDPVNRVGGTRGINEATLDSYPKMLYSGKGVRSSKSVEEEDLEAEDKTCCSICLSDYRESEEVKVMPDCGHMFHAVCIDQWLRGHASCPVCRTSPQLRAPLPEEPRLAIVSQP